jgi:hypothetical protein
MYFIVLPLPLGACSTAVADSSVTVSSNEAPHMIGLTPKDEQVYISHELRKIFMCFFISNLSGVVYAAIQGNVDCED